MATTSDYFSDLDIRLPLVPATTQSQSYPIFTDIDTIFNSLRLLAGGLQENRDVIAQVASDMIPEAPEDGQIYGRQDAGWVVVTGGGGSGIVETIVAGTGISVDSTDPANPVVSATGGGGGGGLSSLIIPYALPTTSAGYANYTVWALLPYVQILQYATSWTFKLRLQVASGNIAIGAIKILTTAANSTAVIASTTVTIGGSATPTITPPGAGMHDYQVDPIALTLEPNKSYYAVVYFTSASNPTLGQGNSTSSFGLFQVGNQTGLTTVPTVSAITMYGFYEFRKSP